MNWFIVPLRGEGYYAERAASREDPLGMISRPFTTVAECRDWIEEYEAQTAPKPTPSDIVSGMFSASMKALGETK